VGRGGIAVIDVTEAVDCRADRLAVVEFYDGATRIDGLDGGEVAVGDAQGTIGGAELDAVARSEGACFFMVDLDAEEPAGTVVDAASVADRNREPIGLPIDVFDSNVIPPGDTERLTAAGEANDVANFIVRCGRALRSRETPINQDRPLLALGLLTDRLSRRLATVCAATPASWSDLTARVVGAKP
jgi:hypothetical protein